MKTEIIKNFSSTSLTSLGRSSEVSYNASVYHNNNGDSENKIIRKRDHLKNIVTDFGQKTFRKKTLEKKLPILKWLPKYTLEKFIQDLIAGFTVGLTILPQGLAYSVVAGLPPRYGLYSGFIGCFIYIFFGSTKEVTIGPTAVLGIITNLYTRGKPPEYAIILCFITGFVTMLMGIFQLGFIVNFISTPVNSGFTSAAAITICATQIKGLLGLKFAAEGFLPTILGTFDHIHDISFYDSIMSATCIVFLLFLMKLQGICSYFTCCKNPLINRILWFISTARNAIIVIAGFLIVFIMGLEKNPFQIVGKVIPGLPSLKPPPFVIYENATNITHSFTNILQEEGSAIIVIPLLAIMEHITIARAFAENGQIDANQEMICIGLSNILGSFFSSMPVCGSFSRTTVNKMSGAQSPMGGLITGSMVLLALAFLTPYFYFIPKAALAAVIVCAVIFMVDLSVIKPMWKSKKFDILPWSLTFLVSLFVGLEFGMLTGFCISVVYLLYYAARPNVKVKRGTSSKGVEFILVELDRSLTFPSVQYIRYIISKSAQNFAFNQKPLIVDFSYIMFADFTAAQTIHELISTFEKAGQPFILYRAKPSLIRLLAGIKEDFVHCENENELEIYLDDLTLDNSKKEIAYNIGTGSESEQEKNLELRERQKDKDEKITSSPLS